jgi:diaminopimelate epimerase
VTSGIPFYKLSGSGNDFIGLAETEAPPSEASIRAWCRRGLSIGADGLFVLRRLAESPGTLGMAYWNADGKPADLCLNGTRCAAQLAFHLGWADRSLVLQTGSGPITAHHIDSAQIGLEVPPPPEPSALTVELAGHRWQGWRCQVGVPHFVLVWPEAVDRAPVTDVGRALRHHHAFAPAGTNVNFLRILGRDHLELRTYERGVEDETLACGSGAVASAAVARAIGAIDLSVRIETRGGCPLRVGLTGSSWTLAGDARIVARGELLQGALPPTS